MSTDGIGKLSSAQLVSRLQELTTLRSSIKGQITKFKKYLNEFMKKTDVTSIELAELSLKVSKLEALSNKFDTLQSEIEVLNSESLSVELDEREMIEQNIITNLATAKTILEKHSILEIERRNSVAMEAQCSHDHQDQSFKLPQIQISKFDGAYFRWLEFRDTFENLIHKNDRIKPIHKFHYLISYLEGDAARIISNLEVSSANYAEAWKLLGDRYDNKRLLIDHHLSSLFNIQAHTRESERSLRFLVDHVIKNLRALSSLGQPTDKWDMLIIFMLSSKLDSRTLMKWEEYRNTIDDVPTLDQFHKFLIDRADVLEALNRNKCEPGVSRFPPTTSRTSPPTPNRYNNYNNNKHDRNAHVKSFAGVNQKSKQYFNNNQYQNNKPATSVCIICSDNHKIYECSIFAAKNMKEKLADVANYKLCANCLRQGHPVNECRGGPCRECKQMHNSLLHEPSSGVKNNAATLSHPSTTANFSNLNNKRVLLSTALIEVSNPKTNQKEKVRVLLDNGSESSFITKSLKDRLSLESIPDCLKVIGIGKKCTDNIVERCNAQLNSLHGPFKVDLTCYVLEELTSHIPKYPVNIQSLQIPSHIQLADPDFNQPAAVDVLIGADMFWDILGTEKYSMGPHNPTLRNSEFGWLISGPIYTKENNKRNKEFKQNKINCNHALISQSQENIENMLTRFWEIEEIPNNPILNENDTECEKHFLTHTERLDTGRFYVKLPLTESPECLGDSYNLAKKRFLNLERKFKRNPTLKSEYTKFINEYAQLGHLSESTLLKPNPNYFLCHHAVLKESSESTSLRVVFDGSAATSTGKSLNDILMVGPNVQDSLFSILIRARQYKYILSGDIEKMYRQVQIHEEDRNLQLIIWREDESEALRTLRLNTLTYGTGSASYLSTRCLFQVGEEQQDQLIKTIIQKDFYVDDLITGSNDENELRYIQKSVSEALMAGCFNLRKYKSNLPSLFEDSNVNTRENLIISESASTLGLGWSPISDTLNFTVKDPPSNDKITKRFIMSNTFKIFDPLGCLSLCIIKPKMLLQQLWQLKYDFDQAVPESIKKEWDKFSENLQFIQNLKINRRVLCDSPKLIEMHVFSDASQLALGACVYIKSIAENDDVTVRLLCAKSKVAPLKATTIPRLELSAALLAARLSKAVLTSLRYKPDNVTHWCDSSIVLGWIHNKTAKLKTYVANRVNEILEKTHEPSWRYVPTSTNPADLISRGADANQLPKLDLWWNGPTFLTQPETEWPVLNNHKIDLPEVKSCIVNIEYPLVNFEKYSTLNRLHRTFAYVHRAIFNFKNPKDKRVGVLTVEELSESFKFMCVVAQRQSFQIEYEVLSKSKPLNSKSKILKLSPFMDEQKVIRVGGRIDASDYPYEKKHQILLHASHRLTKLIFAHEHLKGLHAPPQLLLSNVKETVWPVNGRRLAQRTVNSCMRCRRVRGGTLTPKMGNLPAQRINPDFPFVSVGLDFAGPFYILNRKGRGAKLIKCYLCLFVCLRYKCLHLEAVSDLTKNAFIMTLRRFIARRGKPVEIFCDNGRNFVAAAKELGQFLKTNQEPLSDFANQEYIKFIFTPTYAPHFGGIWEAGVKSAKHHIKRVVGNSHLTFEEICTLFAQVEAILNSRPLCPMSSSPDDFLSLSPGHFLIGKPLTALPSPALENCKESSLQRYARIEKIRQHFWQRWQKEYISELQERTKWRTNSAKLKLGDLVLLHEDHVPPLCWRLGRVTRLFPGPDGVTRVADVTTTKGCVRRPLVRICPLPTAEDVEL